MQRFWRRLPSLTYESRFLWKVALAVITLGVGVGYIFFHLNPESREEEYFAVQELNGEGTPNPFQDYWSDEKSGDRFSQFLDHISMLLGYFRDEGAFTGEALVEPDFTKEQKDIASLLIRSILHSGKPDTGLVALAEQKPPAPYANFALGCIWRSHDYPFHAARAFERENDAHPNELARENAVENYLRAEAFTDLDHLRNAPDYQQAIEEYRDSIDYELAILKRDWTAILQSTLAYQFVSFDWQFMLIALLTGIAWFCFLMHAGRLWRRPGDIAVCGAAFFLGVLSTTATLLIIVLEENVLGFQEKYDLVGGLLYCIGGIGLREEFCKLLFYVPLLPFLVKKKDHQLAFIAAACVGLGFAAEENISYFGSSFGMAGPGRFLTANFFHTAATALTGYALYRAAVTKWRELDHFATVFGVVVIVHGLYDAFIMLPALVEFSFLNGTVYVLLCYQMFHVLEQVRAHQHQRISLSFVFTLALSVILSVSLGWITSIAGLEGIRALSINILGVAVIIILFFRVINEPLRT